MKEFDVIQGDCLAIMRSLDDDSIDSIVTDPPYGLSREPDAAEVLRHWLAGDDYNHQSRGFMGKTWDSFVPGPSIWREALRVLKPGGYMLCFSGSRTYDLTVMAIRLAGFEIRDQVQWVYGSGFNKAGMLKNKAADQWCKCDGEQNTEYILRQMWDFDLQAQKSDESTEGQVLLQGMPQSSVSSYGSKGHESGHVGREESSMEGRQLYRTTQGIPHDQNAGSSESKGERLCSGADLSGRKNAGTSAHEGRGGSSREQEPFRQQSRQSKVLQESSGTLDDRTLRGRGQCPRCGGISQAFNGFGGSLKPAHEPIALARKPLMGTVAENVQQHGTGALNIDGCRVATVETWNAHGNLTGGDSLTCYGDGLNNSGRNASHDFGRWPANLIHDGSNEVEAAFAVFGKKNGGHDPKKSKGTPFGGVNDKNREERYWSDTGTASRFFYCAKASKKERWKHVVCSCLAQVISSNSPVYDLKLCPICGDAFKVTSHPTQKPETLMRYLCRLITPPGGLILDPFAGTGSTGRGALLEGFRFIGIELEREYAEIARLRIKAMGGEDGTGSSDGLRNYGSYPQPQSAR